MRTINIALDVNASPLIHHNKSKSLDYMVFKSETVIFTLICHTGSIIRDKMQKKLLNWNPES